MTSSPHNSKSAIPADDATAAELVADLLAIEAEIAEQQDAKGTIYKAARETYGKRFANGLKLAVKIERMDQSKLSEADEVDAEAERILAAFRKPRAPRATGSANPMPVPEHDADGVIIETEEIGSKAPAAAALSAPTVAEEINPIQPETANEVPDEPTNGGLHESAAHPAVEPLCRRHDNDQDGHSAGGQTNEAVTISAPIAEGEGALIASSASNILTREQGILRLRPKCQVPGACKSSGGKAHCWSCEKAAQQLGAA